MKGGLNHGFNLGFDHSKFSKSLSILEVKIVFGLKTTFVFCIQYLCQMMWKKSWKILLIATKGIKRREKLVFDIFKKCEKQEKINSTLYVKTIFQMEGFPPPYSLPCILKYTLVTQNPFSNQTLPKGFDFGFLINFDH